MDYIINYLTKVLYISFEYIFITWNALNKNKIFRNKMEQKIYGYSFVTKSLKIWNILIWGFNVSK